MALKVWLPLNGNFNNQGLEDYVFTHNGVTFSEGKIGQAANFNGSVYLNSVKGGPFATESNGFSCSYWLKEDENSTTLGFRVVCTIGKFIIGQYNNKFNAYCLDGSGFDIATTEGQDTLKWTHFAYTMDADKHVKLYVNGEIVKEATASKFPTTTGLPFVIGRRTTTGTTNFNGLLNDFRIYDECLSPKQVKEISKGLVAHYKLESQGVDNLLPNTSPKKQNFSYSAWNYAPYFYTLEELGLSVGDTITLSGYLAVDKNAATHSALSIEWYNTDNDRVQYPSRYIEPGQEGFCSVTQTVPANYKGGKVRIRIQSAAETGSSGLYWGLKLEKNNTYTIWKPNKADALYTQLGYDKILSQDSSGYGYDGVTGGVLTTSSNTARYTNSTTFGNGWLHSIKAPLNAATEAFTYSIWYYPTATSNAALYNCRTEVGNGFSLFLLNNTDLRFDTGGPYQWTVANCITANQWNHIAITFNKSTGKKIYINGVLKDSTTTPGNLDTLNTIASIGISSNSSNVSGNIVYGNLSDARIYCTELSANDILTLYKTSGIIDNKGNSYAYEFVEED